MKGSVYIRLNPEKRVLASPVWPREINYRIILTPIKGVKDLAAWERLGRKFTFSPFIPQGRGLSSPY